VSALATVTITIAAVNAHQYQSVNRHDH